MGDHAGGPGRALAYVRMQRFGVNATDEVALPPEPFEGASAST
jgi:hypothetical protein